MKELRLKKWFIIVSSIVLIMALGMGMITFHGHGQRNYGTLIRIGRNDVIDDNYHDALNYFQGAQKVNPEGPGAREDLDQTQSYVNGNHYFARQKLNAAAKNYRHSIKIGVIAALNRRSMIDYKKVNLIHHGIARFTLLDDQALILNHRRAFKSSAHRLKRILNDSAIDLTYFKPFKNRVIKLMRADRHDRRSNQITSNVRLGSGGSDQFKLKAPASVSDRPSKVTITKARHEIKRAGVDVNEMSNYDVANLVRQANRHHASVYRYAKNNY